MTADSTGQRQNLIDRLFAGEEAALDELTDRASKRLLGLAHQALKGHARVRPLADTGAVLRESLPGLRQALQALVAKGAPKLSVVEFFCLAAKHMRGELLQLVERLERQARAGAALDTPGQADSSTDNPPLPQPSTASGEGSSVLSFWTEFHREVEALPDMDRKVFELLFYNEIGQAEAASFLQVDQRAIQRHWVSAKRRLGAFMRQARKA
jgi:hypothetical protein